MEARVTPTRLGEYSVAGLLTRYYNKFEALEAAFKAGRPVSFHWDDEFWSAQDWKRAPALSLEDLYAQRVLQLREKYDYLIVMFSGGADSWNVLRVMEKAGAPPEEILCWHQRGLEPDVNARINAEIFKAAVPYGEEYVKRNPGTKLTIADTRDLMGSLPWDHDRIMTHVNAATMSFNNVLQMGYAAVDAALKVKGKRVAIVTGNDKTLIGARNGRYCASFHEIIAYKVRCAMALGPAPVPMEFFYWTPDMPELAIAMAHEIRKRLDALPPAWGSQASKKLWNPRGFATYLTSKQGQHVDLQVVNHWLYGWDTKTFTLGKPGGTYFMSESDLHIRRFKNEEIVQKWRVQALKTYDYLSRIEPKHRDRWNPQLGVDRPIMSTRPYFIE